VPNPPEDVPNPPEDTEVIWLEDRFDGAQLAALHEQASAAPQPA